MFRTTSARLAALYTVAFAFAVVVLGASILLTTRATLRRQFDGRLRSEAAGLTQEFRSEGLTGVVEAVEERDRTVGSLDYGLEAADGAALAGRLSGARAPIGWSRLRVTDAAGRAESIRILTTDLPQGYRLILGDDDRQTRALETTMLQGFAWAFIGVVALGAIGGYGLGHDMHRRLSAMTATAEAIIDGDLGRRIPLRDSDDDLDRVAATFNRMLDRIAALMESLRQVSNDVAHDLRTPLTRLRQRLEISRSASAPEDRAEAIRGALEDMDAILETFAALLRIAQIDSGARRAAFRSVDLRDLAQTVVEAFQPSAEDTGQELGLMADGPCMIFGDRELLTQMVANLVENALRHAGGQARVQVTVTHRSDGAQLSVADDGPGVPEGDRQRILDRFYRLERSRSTPGSGLGLALVAAVARLHGASLRLADARPGLLVQVTFVLGDPATLQLPNLPAT